MRGQESSPVRGTPPERLLALTKERGRIGVILGVRDEAWRPEGLLRAEEVAAQRARVRNLKTTVFSRHRDARVVAARDYVGIPFALVMVTEGSLRQLLADEAVHSIEEDVEGELTLSFSTEHIGATAAHTRQPVGYRGEGQMIVIIDAGVDHTHPFFGSTSRIRQADSACFSAPWESQQGDPVGTYLPLCPNGTSTQTGFDANGVGAGVPCNNSDGMPMSNPVHPCHHGTKVAGIAIGANASMSGVAPGAEVIPIQVASKKCDAFGCVKTLKSDVVAALTYVSTDLLPLYGRKIAAVSISIGFSPRHSSRSACQTATPSMSSAIDTLVSSDVAVVAATGNDSQTELVSTPACLPGVIAVSATTDTDAVPDYANTAAIMDLFAPGGAAGVGNGINTSQNTGCTGCADYHEDRGTSFAAPHVAGAFAILREQSPLASISTLRGHLQQTGFVVTDGRAGGFVQKPRIQIDAALDVAQPASPPTQLSALGTTTQTIQLTWTAPQPPIDGATYRIRVRTSATGPWTEIAAAEETTSYQHIGLTRGRLYQYEVATRSPSGELSVGVTDYGVTRPFADDPMNAPGVNGGTVIKGIFVAELREATDAWRAFAPGGLAPAFSDYDVPPTGLVRASHLTDIVTALNQARDNIGALGSFEYVGVSDPAVGVVVDRRHVEQLRAVMR